MGGFRYALIGGCWEEEANRKLSSYMMSLGEGAYFVLSDSSSVGRQDEKQRSSKTLTKS